MTLPPPSFNATEVTNFAYGRGLDIPDTEGNIRHIDDFKDQITLVFFGFTRCPDVCPTTLMRLRQVRDSLGEDADEVQVLLVSVDPERDTPDRLGAYVKSFDESFIGLRPEPATLEKVVEAFGAIAVKVPTKGDDYTIDHSATIYVYDRQSRLRLIAQPNLEIDRFASDLRRLIQERRRF
ncbi:MAG: SCO family protein [Gammaproteobacteria bacterium]|nr:SCO family protein [Gammaproteobacteria bacterium]